MLAYLGDRVWIEADPNLLVGDRVIEVAARSPRIGWLQVPARIVRWRVLGG